MRLMVVGCSQNCVARKAGQITRAASRNIAMMLRKIMYFASLGCMALTNSISEAQSNITRHNFIRQYRNSTSSTVSDTTTLDLTLSTSTKVTQTTDHMSISEWPTTLSTYTQVTDEFTSTTAVAPTPEQTPSSIKSETAQAEPLTPGYSISTARLSLDSTLRTESTLATVIDSPFTMQTETELPSSVSMPAASASTSRSPSAGISTTTDYPETTQPLASTLDSALASTSRFLSPSSATTTKDSEHTKPVLQNSSPVSTVNTMIIPTLPTAVASNEDTMPVTPLLPTSSSAPTHTSTLETPSFTTATSLKQTASLGTLCKTGDHG
ncbi:hypothetical protein NQ176_g6731 [Zarea fungicola]|uniref:Uncharacterized protein n=1 Tax=Zarea fungicola TaxID=93591 RepID=A0ACC1N453_9HYPO|nr:hypothetical protein NQ176_g6731 [Lecanicillium fungicola]